MKAKLRKFRVQNFRSIVDSDWILSNDNNCLIGTNESGKTNLLLALWKLKPANDEPIIPLIDYPRKKYVDYKETKGNEIFISAEFELEDKEAENLSTLSGWHKELCKTVLIQRRYNGDYIIQLSKNKINEFPSNELIKFLESIKEKINNSDILKNEDEVNKKDLIDNINRVISDLQPDTELDKESIENALSKIEDNLTSKYSRKKNINSFFENNYFSEKTKLLSAFSEQGIELNKNAKEFILKTIPTFVYYSDYGNLDTEIYLPHVIENMGRDDLGEKERAKVRSLKVLFDFVKLSPEEILELGKEALPRKVITIQKDQYNREINRNEDIEHPEYEDINEVSEHKKEREILLQSASTKLTQDFKNWWKQGNYKFRFQADGNHFRIWVSDEKRSEEIELEGRSRGLQWFFSFFLVFLVESKDAHSNCILLLDEPGISLHPVAQMDLIRFFSSLSKDNQIIYTTHSPFLVDANNLGNVYAMFIGENGESIVSPDLRANIKISSKSIYPVHAAIGLTVSETLLLGSDPILVEGVSDQIYLQLIKRYILSIGKYKNKRELVFVPTGGVKGMSPVIKILLGRDNNLPFVVLDADNSGIEKKKQLENDLYKEEKNKILTMNDFLGEGEWEIEDLMPNEELARIFAKKFRRVNSEDEFDYIYDKDKPIVPQMEKFANENGYKLEKGWKVELAKDFQKSFDRIVDRIPEDLKEKWINLIQTITE
jgi:predicted ATP-dependent endonuclease of OLD family